MARVTVMGGGVFGLAVAFECARRGASVQVIERDRIGAGASGGIVGALAPHVPAPWNAKKAFQLDILVMAGEFWAQAARLSGVDPGHARIGRVQPLADERAVAAARERGEAARAHWPDWARWTVTDAPGWAVASPTGLFAHDTLSARIHPRGALRALAGALRALGAEVIEGREAPRQGAVVWATGAAGLAALSAGRGRAVGAPAKGQALLLDLDARAAPQLHADGLHIVPHADGTTAIGSTSERDFDDPAATDAQLDAVHARAVAACPALAGAPVIERWAGLRPRARSRAPMLGRLPDGDYVANGGFKIGFGMAPKAAEVMADLILEGRDAIPEGFRFEDNL